MLSRLLNQRQLLETDQEAFDQQVTDFLTSSGFPDDVLHRRLFAMMIQHLPEGQDTFSPRIIKAAMRRAKTNECAFYVIHPDKRKKVDEPEGTSQASEEVG